MQAQHIIKSCMWRCGPGHTCSPAEETEAACADAAAEASSGLLVLSLESAGDAFTQ